MTIFGVTLFASLFLIGCGSSSSKNSKVQQIESNSIETKQPKESKSTETNTQEILRNPEPRLDLANVFWKKEYTLFDFITDEPIFPISKGGKTIYQIYYSSNEDPTAHFGEFTPEQLEKQLFYKFKNKENCQKFCDSK